MGRVGDYAQYAALRAVVAGLETLGTHRAGAVGAALGRFGHARGIRRRVAEDQIAMAFPDLSRAEVERVARAAYENLGRTSVETAVLPSLASADILAMFESVEGWEHVAELLAQGKGLILVGGHIGNWELAGAYLGARGVTIEAVARHMANQRVDRYLTDARESTGMRVVHDDEAVRRVPRLLRSGGTAAFLVDQAALGLASTWVPFFGRDAKTPRGPAVFALRLGVPVVFAAAIRQPSNRYHMVFEPVTFELSGDRETDVDRIVFAYTAVLERWVRRVPEQYFWQHRRWKQSRPLSTSVDES